MLLLACGEVLRTLLGNGVDPTAVASACADTIVWDDLASRVHEGPSEVEAMLRAKFPPTSRLVVERTAGDATSGGVTWHRASAQKMGLRGTIFAKLDDDCKLCYVREASEPIFKAGELTEKLLRAVSSPTEKVKTYVERTPKTACDIVEYLWREAYPKGATPDVALGLFADDIVYEDLNYAEPFVGKPAVKDFVEAFDIPGIDFVPLEISGGEEACCFTWKVVVNGNDGPNGVSFYGVDDNGKVNYIRDIPAVAPAPLQQLAAFVNPDLRTFG